MFHVFQPALLRTQSRWLSFSLTTRENFFAAGGFDEIYYAAEEVFFNRRAENDWEDSAVARSSH